MRRQRRSETSPTRSLSAPSGDASVDTEVGGGASEDPSGVFWYPEEPSGAEPAGASDGVNVPGVADGLGATTSEAGVFDDATSGAASAEPIVRAPSPHVAVEPSDAPARPAVPPKLTDKEFEALVESALSRIPPELMEAVENCAIIVEAEPPPGQPGLLGLYQGQPLTSRGYYAGAMPDRITIYQGSLQRLYRDPEKLEEQVYRTVVHEIGHYFGFEEDELHELGWG